MTKDQLQKELKEKVKEGIKPSHLKKLKKSRSESDLPKTPSSLSELEQLKKELQTKSTTISLLWKEISSLQDQLKNSNPSEQTKVWELELEKLKQETQTKSTTISLLRKRNDELEKQFQKNPPTPLLQTQLSEKQKEVESLRETSQSLRKQLEETHQKLTQSNTELDTSLEARHTSLQAWWIQYSQNKALDQELQENIEQATTELINQDKELVVLRSQVQKLKLEKQNLVRDLNLSQRVNELRKYPLPNPENLDYLKYALYCLLVAWFISLLNSSWKLRNYE